jgi:tetratricopeptide (TPR) repeat protein
MHSSRYPFSSQQKTPLRHSVIPVLQGLFGTAFQLHQQGRLAEAELRYRQVLDQDSRHADSLHLLGTLAHQTGRNEMAVELIRKAIAVNKRQAAYHSNLGTAFQALGKLNEAMESYRKALSLNPNLAEAHMNLGVVLNMLGKQGEAEARLRKALALRPDLAEVHLNLGNILQAQGKLDEAVASQQRALTLRPQLAEAHFSLGNTRQAQGKLEEAAESYWQALALRPDLAVVHVNLGNVLLAQEKREAAVACYERALSLKPDYAEVYYNLGNARQAQDKLDEAVACYERALILKPHLAEAHYNLGNTRQAQGNLDQAIACYERALLLSPNYAAAHYNLGYVLRELGRPDEALQRYARAVELQPDYYQARFAQALAQVLTGDFANGWCNYEYRWQSTDHDTPLRPYPQPHWKGEKLAAGSVLIWGEQGIGDEIMFAGLIPDAIRTGNRIVLDCDARLKPLFARSFPEIEVMTGHTAADVLEPEVAAHLPIASLPRLYRSSEGTFAGTKSPYLKADPAEVARFRTHYGEDRKLVGLAWHTKAPKTGRKRSIDLSLLAPLLARPDTRWISLQYGDFDVLEEQAEAACVPILIDRSVDQFTNVDLFAAQIAAMDRVITIDNSTAHLAGALGVPVWLLLPFASDWRWLREREDSPWYPTMRIFRQPRLGDWDSVVESVQKALGMAFPTA